MVTLPEIVHFLDGALRISEIPDEPNALNGLQVEASEKIGRIACAVDAGEATLEEAVSRGAQLLIVHHGLFWAGNNPIKGPMARKLRLCFTAGLSVYSAHLPLDLHPEHGNNVLLLKELGLTADGTFGNYRGTEIGLTATCDLSIQELRFRLEAAVGSVRQLGRGGPRVRRLGVITGSGGSFVSSASARGLDALVSGEGAHHTAVEAEERGVHLLLAGHYRTEVFGVKALGSELEKRFGVESSFIEHDTGL
jgi:dinuclear metal center YbgI/SA1388 family protein